MPYVITDACIDVKDKTCLDACPVDCIYEGAPTSSRMRASLRAVRDRVPAGRSADDRLPEELKP